MGNMEYLSSQEFKRKLKEWGIEKAELKDMNIAVLKQLVADTSELGERKLSFVITTSAKDRDNDTINPLGWKLDNYLKNPVVLWAHSYESPAVARTEKIWIEDNSVKAIAEFTPQEVYPFGYTLYLLYREGFMKAVSVGFIPLSWEVREDGFDYIEQELLEYSLVPVPSNPEALLIAKRKGIDIKPLIQWAEDILEKTGEFKVITKEVYEQIEMAKNDKEPKIVDIPVEKGVIPYKRTPLAPEDEPWDAGEEVKNADVKDLKIMCAWYDSSNPDVKSSYKLPHHKASGQHSCVWRGVAAAMAALFGARGGVDIPESDRKGVYNHLAKHYKDFDKEPPEFKEYTEEELKQIFPEFYEEQTKEEKEDLETENKIEEKAEIIGKAGRVLSKANEEKIRKAVELLNEVLSQLEQEPEEPEKEEIPIIEVIEEEDETINSDAIKEIVQLAIESEIKKILGKID